MPASAEMIWDSALSLLRRRVASETGNLWFQPVRATDLTQDCITLEVADEFSSAWLAERHLGVSAGSIKPGRAPTVGSKIPGGCRRSNGRPSGFCRDVRELRNRAIRSRDSRESADRWIYFELSI